MSLPEVKDALGLAHSKDQAERRRMTVDKVKDVIAMMHPVDQAICLEGAARIRAQVTELGPMGKLAISLVMAEESAKAAMPESSRIPRPD